MLVVKPEQVTIDAFTVVGIQVRTKNSEELNPQTAKLHQHWERFFQTEIPNRKKDSALYGIYSEYASDFSDFYTVTAGVEVNSDAELVPHLHKVQIQSGNYLLFKNTGPIPQAIYETWEVIWSYFAENPQLVRAYGTDFEVCPEPERCEIYIGIRA